MFPPEFSLACYGLPDGPVVQREGVEVGIGIDPVFFPVVPWFVTLRVSCRVLTVSVALLLMVPHHVHPKLSLLPTSPHQV